MATSSKVQFALEALREQATSAIDARIKVQEEVVAIYQDEAAHTARITEWRAEQEERIHELSDKIASVSDVELLRFKIAPQPETDKFEARKATRDLANLRDLKAQIEAKAASLVPDEDGNITLTKTQLSDFFGL